MNFSKGFVISADQKQPFFVTGYLPNGKTKVIATRRLKDERVLPFSNENVLCGRLVYNVYPVEPF